MGTMFVFSSMFYTFGITYCI